MSKSIDLIGKRFHRLIVVKIVNNDKWGHRRLLCKCDCGKEKIITTSSLISGDTKSCGCFSVEKTIKRFIKHNHSQRGPGFRTYQTWQTMIQRCTNLSNIQYENYGGRGITVCKRWKNFTNFLEDMGERSAGYSIERKNNNKGYYKNNCCWATPEEQQRNRRDNHLETHDGKTQCITAWAEETGISAKTILWRLNNNWTIEKTLTKTPKHPKRKDTR